MSFITQIISFNSINFNFHIIHDRTDSLFNSVTSAAKASGLAPSSNNWEQMFKVSRSKPVPNKFDISKTTKDKRG